ncbi:MAG: putative metal-binding motif-containing protein [Sandaracinaceae bacterium]
MTRRMTRWLWFALLLLPSSAAAQEDCDPGDEFCLPPPPCYREPDNPDCNPECTCDSPDYPACDPYCAPGDICDPECANPCWDEFGRTDICSDPPPPCEEEDRLPFTFIDNRDGSDDGEIFALGNRSPTRSCGTVTVETTGYYSIFDIELSESCDDQEDETGYLTVSNGCNPDGWAVERNAGDRFLVADSDNSPDCTDDAECGSGEVCRAADSHGRCCVPDSPVFMGTFLLVAGQDNEICINHWCPEWQEELDEGRDFGFAESGCSGVNSIHFRIGATAVACLDETTLHACTWGCGMDGCNPDPCDTVSCDGFCMDGVCTDDNPCDSVTCTHGCVRGRCLQPRHARGPDNDEDGFSELADCDDTDATVNPDRPELCADGVDNNCDGDIDEAGCEGGSGDGGTGSLDGSTGGLDGGVGTDGGPGGETDGGCGCRAAGSGRAPSTLWLAAFALLGLRRRP